MYTTFNPSTKRTAFELAQIALDFCAIRKQKQLATLLKSDKILLENILQNPDYHTFTIPKANGGQRVIDTPGAPLKAVQKVLQDYLQAVYYQVRPRSVHGAIISAAGETKPRSLLTNAKAHVGKKFFLNVDLKNFYHTIKADKVRTMFEAKAVFNFPPKVAALLTRLVCYQNRLPMGTSTSGIVSNFCLLELDKQLQALADKNAWTYTRFIDDLTFSSKNSFTTEQTSEIRAIIGVENLFINDEKWSATTIDEQPEITGLVLMGSRVDIKPSYVKQLGADITLYRKLLKCEHLHKKALFSAPVLRHFKLHLQGQLSFMRYIRGKMDVAYVRLANRMKAYQVAV
jgi:RNA-directed DNA polymerase